MTFPKLGNGIMIGVLIPGEYPERNRVIRGLLDLPGTGNPTQ